MQATLRIYDHSFHEDPYGSYAELRDQAPVIYSPEDDFWALSRHADVAAALRDYGRFSSVNGPVLDPDMWGSASHLRAMSFLAMDPPLHTRMRRLVSHAFRRRRVEAMGPQVEIIARRYLIEALERGTFDLISDLAAPLPVDVISELVGVPEADRAQIRRLQDLIIHREHGSSAMPKEAVSAAATLWSYYSALIDDRRSRPREDLATTLIEATDSGDRLTTEEITGVIFMLMAAGIETTRNLIGNAWHVAWQHPDERAKAFGGRIDDWISETLRYDSPSQALARTATTDVKLHDALIPAGARVLLLLGAANRDPAVFAHPDCFDLDRQTGETIDFGQGPHHCLGAPLARLEARVVLRQLTEKVQESYDIDGRAARRVHHPSLRGFASLPTSVTPRPRLRSRN